MLSNTLFSSTSVSAASQGSRRSSTRSTTATTTTTTPGGEILATPQMSYGVVNPGQQEEEEGEAGVKQQNREMGRRLMLQDEDEEGDGDYEIDLSSESVDGQPHLEQSQQHHSHLHPQHHPHPHLHQPQQSHPQQQIYYPMSTQQQTNPQQYVMASGNSPSISPVSTSHFSTHEPKKGNMNVAFDIEQAQHATQHAHASHVRQRPRNQQQLIVPYNADIPPPRAPARPRPHGHAPPPLFHTQSWHAETQNEMHHQSHSVRFDPQQQQHQQHQDSHSQVQQLYAHQPLYAGRPPSIAEQHLAPRPSSALPSYGSPHMLPHDGSMIFHPSGPHLQPEHMQRSFSDPFAAGPSHTHSQMGGNNNNNGSPEMMYTVAPGSVGGGQPDLVYHTPLGKNGKMAHRQQRGALASSPFTGTGSPGSAQKDGTTPTTSQRSLTPASTYSAGDSTYQPSNGSNSIERPRDYQPPPMMGDDDDDDFEDEAGRLIAGRRTLYPQSSPLRNRKGAKSGKSPTTLQPSSKSKNGVKSGSGIIEKDFGRKDVTASGVLSGNSSKRDSKVVGGTSAKEDYLPEGVPLGPRSADKPHYSYAALIGQAINACPRKRLALSQIYAWISAAYPYFKKGDAGWMNSIRHNLSLNDCFVKNDRKTDDAAGKGSVWMIADGCEHMFASGNFKKTTRAKPSASSSTEPTMGVGPATALGAGAPLRKYESQHLVIAHMSNPALMHSNSMPLTMPSSSPMAGAGAGKKQKIGDVAIPYIAPHASQNSLPQPPVPVATSDASDNAVSESIEAADQSLTKPVLTSMPPPSRPQRPSSGPGIMEVDDPSSVDARHFAKLRQLPSSSPAQGCAPGSLRVSRDTPGASSPAIAHLHPLTFLQEVARKRTNDSLEDDFTTPHRQIKMTRKDHVLSSGAYDMLPPHLTHSASSPMSSPAPQTIDRNTASAQTSIIIRRSDGSVDDSDSVMPDIATKQKLPNADIQLEPSVEFIAPAIPPKHQNHLLNSPGNKESVTLSPIRRSSRNDNLTLPPPTELLSKTGLPGSNDLLSARSPKSGSIHRRYASTDLLSHFASPSRSSNRTEMYTTPLGKESSMAASRLRSLNTPNFMTPMRSSTAMNIFNETPVALTKMQFMAEHGLLESPMGLGGSCYDITNTEYSVDWELEHIHAQSQTSPTKANSHRHLPSHPLTGSL